MTADRSADGTPGRRPPYARELPAPPSGRVVLAALIALGGVWGVSAWFGITHPSPGPVDTGWDALMSGMSSPLAHTVAAALAFVGTGLPGTGLAVLLGVLIGLVRGWSSGAFVVAASIISALDVAGMKALAHRARPDPAFGLLNAFPSGHTAYAALLGTVVLLLVHRMVMRVVAIGWIVAMAWSRTELHAHWLTDVLAGIVVGVATAVLLLAMWLALARRLSRERYG